MAKLVIIGDTHFTDKEPLRSAQKLFLSWLSESKYNVSENSFLSLGDLFDRYNPSPSVNADVIDFFQNKLKMNSKYIISGNYRHEVDSIKKTWAIQVLSPLEGVELIHIPSKYQIDNLKFLALPWYSKTMYPSLPPMKEYYENYPDDNYDFIFGHICDQDIFGEMIDISHFRGKKILGHIHKSDGHDNFLGTPYPVRKDEAGKKNRIAIIDTLTKELEYVEVPKFIDYFDITYPEMPETTDDFYCIYDVYNAPSKNVVDDFYSNLYIRKNGVHLQKIDSGNSEESTDVVVTLIDYMKNFCVEKNLNDDQTQLLMSLVRK